MLLNDYTDKILYPATKTKPLGAKKLRLPKKTKNQTYETQHCTYLKHFLLTDD